MTKQYETRHRNGVKYFYFSDCRGSACTLSEFETDGRLYVQLGLQGPRMKLDRTMANELVAQLNIFIETGKL